MKSLLNRDVPFEGSAYSGDGHAEFGALGKGVHEHGFSEIGHDFRWNRKLTYATQPVRFFSERGNSNTRV